MRRPFSMPWLALSCLLLVIFLYSPLVIAVVFAFNGANSLTWPPRGFSLRWFELIFGDPGFRDAITTSVAAATVTSAITAVIGAAAALVFTRTRSRVSTVVEALSRLPVMLPPLFMGIGLVALMKVLTMTPSLTTIVIGHILITIPFVILVIVARLRTFDVELELAARDLGATPSQAIQHITLPLVAPALFGAALLAFAFSFDETLVTNFTSGIQSTVPIYVLGRLHRSADPGANAVAVILLLIPWVSFAIGQVVLKRLTGSGLTEALMQRTA